MKPTGKKRPLEMEQKTYIFKIGVPGGVTIDLRLVDPVRKMGFEDFINSVKKKYLDYTSQHPSRSQKSVTWKGQHVYLEDEDDNKLSQRIDFDSFEPNKCHFLKFHDGSSVVSDSYENMWDLTPDIDLLKELPEEYAFETALADLIDNSLQAVWSNFNNNRRFIRISLFDTGPGMDNSKEHNISKWGKMGASLHRSSKLQAIGGQPPYLRPNFGMFGYGGPMASMHLGRRAIVSSKTKESAKVYVLYLEREALLKKSSSELAWKTRGSMRNPTEDEIRESPHGSFTKVDILELKMKKLDTVQLQCRLKDIYFPYIQCDDLSKEGKTTTQIKFQVNGVDLAEIEGGEVSVTNLLSCNGPEFVFQLHFSLKQAPRAGEDPRLRKSQEANARLKFAYFPIVEGQESIEKILEKLKDEGCTITENFETFSRVSIRRLGRLLPDARWARLPFMDFKQRKGDKVHILKRCCSRVKCFIDTDAGFIPTRPKTDLAHHNAFANVLRNFSGKMGKDSEVSVKIFRDGKTLNPELLEKEYQEWILQMHERYDEECDAGDDDADLVINPKNKKKLGISSDVVRVHRALKRKGASWKSGQKIKVLKGACPGLLKTNLFATLEYFLIEGFQGDAGGEARIICRPLEVAEEHGCLLVKNEEASLDIRNSLSLPISIIDSKKCIAIELAEWDRQVKKHGLGAPSAIDLLDVDHCQELEIDGVFPFDRTIDAGDVPPSEIVAVVRPESYFLPRTSNSLDQKYIVKNLSEIVMEVNYKEAAKDYKVQHIYSNRVPASSRRGFAGLYIFPMNRLEDLFQRAGIYTFKFSLVGLKCKDCEKSMEVRASSESRRWKLLSENNGQPYIVRAGSTLKELAIVCLDKYDNQIPFVLHPNVTVQIKFHDLVILKKEKVKTTVSFDKLTLEVEDVLFESDQLDKLRPSYEANLVICPQDKLDPVSIPCKVIPGPLKNVEVGTMLLENQLLPGFIVKDLILKMFDAYGNRVPQGLQVQLDVRGFRILDRSGSNRKVDYNGCIDLSGLLKVTAGFGKFVSISVSCDNTLVFNQEFRTGERKLRIASEMPVNVTAKSQIENTVFEVVNSEGVVDKTFHNEDKSGQSHTLQLKSDIFNTGDIRYTFWNGRCTVPLITVPEIEGDFCFVAAHSRHPELQLEFNISVKQAPKMNYDEVQTPSSDAKMSLLQDSPLLEHIGNSQSVDNAGNLVLPLVNFEKGREEDIYKYGEKIGKCESQLKSLNEVKGELEQKLYYLEDSFNLSCVSTREEIVEHIQKRSNSAAAILCHLSRDVSSQESQEQIVGVVALLGTVSDNKLSRILAAFLTEDQMCALVCTSYEAATAIEKCKENGEVDYELAGQRISGRFHVICLEKLRVFRRGMDDKGKLVLPDPVMPSGDIATGFIGYAVNMVEIAPSHRNFKTSSGYGLRETLFFRLFGKLQVYDTRDHMYKAMPSIKHGAISLDGVTLRKSGIMSFGCGDPVICFPVDEMQFSSQNIEKKKEHESLKKNLQEVNNTILKVTEIHEKSIKKFRKKSEQFKNSLEQIEDSVRAESELEEVNRRLFSED
ncbi:structural maintenance of chromosomes flexible hinge domain-containing protein GMI1 isoform X2 [Euphorbia lathyris]|uniref:structural maintenance of chromosomes flexible hinge domain-containing protein GMI1 isoform X2 n=1 Tax=Euphorbia lathyris TaxID=212925 RepID=UPI00331349DC